MVALAPIIERSQALRNHAKAIGYQTAVQLRLDSCGINDVAQFMSYRGIRTIHDFGWDSQTLVLMALSEEVIRLTEKLEEVKQIVK